jgi:hypothetical protein
MLEMSRPNVEYRDADPFSGVYFLTGRVAVGKRIALVAEVPYTRHDSKGTYWYTDHSGATFGNVYLGAEFGSTQGPLFIELGTWARTARDDEYSVLDIAGLADASRWPAFRDRQASIHLAMNVREVAPSGLGFKFRAGPLATFPEEEGYVVHAMEVGYSGNWARVGVGLGGSLHLTGAYRNFYTGTSRNIGQTAETDWTLHADFLSGPVRPGVGLRLPLGARAEVIPVVLGVSLTVAP